MTHKLLEEFAQALIDKARDSAITETMWIIDGTKNSKRTYPEIVTALSTLSDEQREAVKELIYTTVDSVLHNVLYTLEYSNIATLRLQQGEEVVEDIRKVLAGDLQGYLFYWVPKYSKQPWSIDVRTAPWEDD